MTTFDEPRPEPNYVWWAATRSTSYDVWTASAVQSLIGQHTVLAYRGDSWVVEIEDAVLTDEGVVKIQFALPEVLRYVVDTPRHADVRLDWMFG